MIQFLADSISFRLHLEPTHRSNRLETFFDLRCYFSPSFESTLDIFFFFAPFLSSLLTVFLAYAFHHPSYLIPLSHRTFFTRFFQSKPASIGLNFQKEGIEASKENEKERGTVDMVPMSQ